MSLKQTLGVMNHQEFFSNYYFSEILHDKIDAASRKRYLNHIKPLYRDYRLYLKKSELRSKEKKLEATNDWYSFLFEKLGYDGFKGVSQCTFEKVNGMEVAFFKPSNIDDMAVLFAEVDDDDESLKTYDPVVKAGNKVISNLDKHLQEVMDLGVFQYFMVACGEQIRLYQKLKSTESYLEVDLSVILPSDEIDSFCTFWFLFNRESFQRDEENSCAIDRVGSESHKKAQELAADLRGQLRSCVEILVNNWIAQPEFNKSWNSLLKGKQEAFLSDDIEHDLHAKSSIASANFQGKAAYLTSEALFIMYRFLFLLYAEAQNKLNINSLLFRHYTFESLRDMAEGRILNETKQKFSLDEQIKVIFDIYLQGDETLGIKQYNGQLFARSLSPIFWLLKTPNHIWREIILSLSLSTFSSKKGKVQKTGRMDYGALGVTQLGSIYEGLLAYEPQIAEEDMEEIEAADKKIYLISKEEIKNQKLSQFKTQRQINSGEYVLSKWGGEQKKTGSFYTDEGLSRSLVEETLKESLAKCKCCEDVLKIKVIESSMGSGAFLIQSIRLLGRRYFELQTLPQFERLNLDQAKAKVLQNCIYGVDINPLAVELAKISLWLETIKSGVALPLQDQKLRCGNSIIGVQLDHKVKVKNKEFWSCLLVADGVFNHLSNDYHWPTCHKDTLTDLKAKNSSEVGMVQVNQLNEQMIKIKTIMEPLITLRKGFSQESESANDVNDRTLKFDTYVNNNENYNKVRLIFDLWCSTWFWPREELNKLPTQSKFSRLVESILNGTLSHKDPVIKIVKSVAKEKRFFHWHLEFPEIFLGDHQGFSALVGNCPWGKMVLEKKSHIPNFMPKLSKGRAKEINKVYDKLQAEDHFIYRDFNQKAISWELDRRFLVQSGHFEAIQGGNMDLFKPFVEIYKYLLKPGGEAGYILPASLYSNESNQKLRNMLYNKASFKRMIVFGNEKGLFPIHKSYKFSLVNYKNTPNPKYQMATCFNLQTIEDLEKLESALEAKQKGNKGHIISLDKNIDRIVYMDQAFINTLNPKTGNLFEFKSNREVEIVQKLYQNGIRISELEDDYQIEFGRDLDMSLDAKCFISYADKSPNHHPLLIGRQFNLFKPYYQNYDHETTVNGKSKDPVYHEVDDCLNAERISHYYVDLKDPNTLRKIRTINGKPASQYWRVFYRKIARATDFRSFITTCLQNEAAGDSANWLYSNQKYIHGLSYALSTILTDFMARIVLNMNVQVGAIKNFPVNQSFIEKYTKDIATMSKSYKSIKEFELQLNIDYALYMEITDEEMQFILESRFPRMLKEEPEFCRALVNGLQPTHTIAA